MKALSARIHADRMTRWPPVDRELFLANIDPATHRITPDEMHEHWVYFKDYSSYDSLPGAIKCGETHELFERYKAWERGELTQP